jgi:hypothetical protein
MLAWLKSWPGKTVTDDFSLLGNNIFDPFPIVKKSRPSYGGPNKGHERPLRGRTNAGTAGKHPETVFAKSAAVRTRAFRLLWFCVPTQL